MAEQRGIDQLTEEERLRLLNLMKADASCLMIGQQIRQHQIDGLENVDVFMVSSAKIYIDLARFGPISEATSVILDIGQAVLEGEDSEAVYILDIVKLAIADTEPPGNKPPHEQALSVIEQGSSLVENTNEAVRSYKAMLQDARKIGELKSAHQVRCTPVVNQGGRR